MVIKGAETKKLKSKKSKRKKNELIIEEKILITGLDEATILKIESKAEDITIRDLKIYCSQLKLNFKTYFIKNFIPPVNDNSLKRASKNE